MIITTVSESFVSIKGMIEHFSGAMHNVAPEFRLSRSQNPDDYQKILLGTRM
jgi:hypothetical protein